MQAANTTEMWILTHGVNLGITKAIGDAVHDELKRRAALQCHKHPHQNLHHLPLTLLGVTREDFLAYGDMLDGRSNRVEIENEGNVPEENKYELNADHSHFIVVKDGTISKTGINYFLLRLEQYLGAASLSSYGGAGEQEAAQATTEVPVVALLIQGGYECARTVLEHLKKQLPVVVVRGSGGLADILAYAEYEVRQRPQGIWDAEFVENFLKPEISSKIAHKFPRFRDNNLARNTFRDRILECVRYGEQNQQTYLSVIVLHSHTCDLTRLDEYLLRALFKSQKVEQTNWAAQMQKDLYLTLDWNSPHVAMSEVFLKDPSSKFKVDRAVFEEALLRPNREDFVNLFLEQGFQIHKYLTPRKLKHLFVRVQHQEFFRSVCWEGALGHGLVTKIGKNFLESDLNWLIEVVTGVPHFVDSQSLSLNTLGLYPVDASAAERRALATLALWAVLTHKPKLAMILWKHSDQPIQLALILSMVYDRLCAYVADMGLRHELTELSIQFAKMAAGVLDASHQEATCRAYDVLSESSPDWGHKTAVDIAASARNRTFLAHPCCQKWLTNMFYGNVRMRELPWGPITLPSWFKVLVCAFLIFPMYFWVRFKMDPHQNWDYFREVTDMDSDDENEEDEDEETIKANNVPLLNPFGDAQLKREEKPQSSMFQDKEVFVHGTPNLLVMIQLMWSAPITKFWTYQVMYMVYLGLFSLAVMWPSCGNQYLDTIICAWTFLIILENIRRTIILHQKYKSVPLFFKCVEIGLMCVFLMLYMMGRVVVLFVEPYAARVILCIGLLFFYYRMITIYLPISPTLGPLLYRVKLMVLVDFANFMQMTLLVIISGGIVMHAVLYPDYPFSVELFRRVFHKAWFSLFLTPISDLEDPDFTCPNTGFWPYFFTIQYFVFLKLILLTLLYALFSATASKVQAETDAIWKFQRYQLVIDFANRPRLPPPLSIFSFFYLGFWSVWQCCTWRPARDNVELPQDATGATIEPVDASGGARLSERDYNYWRHLAQDYVARQETEEKDKALSQKQAEMLTSVSEDLDFEMRLLRQLKGRLRELERLMTHSHVYLENIKHLAEKDEERGMISNLVVHHLSRHSPYLGTRIQRFPVPDKYVPWEVMWMDYDPVAFTRPRPEFPLSLQPYVDEDILLLREQQTVSSTAKLPLLHWNCISTNPAGISIDRTSWVMGEDNTPVIFKLDSEGVPRNIMGRTGLRGRGSLPRWGPNHYIFVAITRWHRSKLASVVGSKGLEFVVMRGERRDQLSLPGKLCFWRRKVQRRRTWADVWDQVMAMRAAERRWERHVARLVREER
ncbi:TRPM [Cordylochernes scorpioides]|uniref:TRPM n=1 Tax=Cordylochernes scorpioides TaxID=51811 RepID=A0ABY6KK24_9ARAC|nr:TRPM [Cordylochernes scorpioides]